MSEFENYPENEYKDSSNIVDIKEQGGTKIIYVQKRVHGFFRTLTIIALLVIGILMRLESKGILFLSINKFSLDQIYPIFIIFSTIVIRSYKGLFGKFFGLILFLAVCGGTLTIGVFNSLNPSSKNKFGNDIIYNMPVNNKINLNINSLVGDFEIQGNGTKKFIAGTRKSDRNLFVNSGNQIGGNNFLDLKEDNHRNIIQDYYSNLNVNISDEYQLDKIYLKNLIGNHNINLSGLNWNNFKFHNGIANINISLGDKINSGAQLEIQSALGNVVLKIPRSVGVSLYYKQLLGIFQIDNFESLSGHFFQSKNINEAKSNIKVNINLGIGKFKIQRID
ncbi:MAG: LiaF domain-containing protein [Candidatus Absconditabacterales bacterium]